MAEPFDLIRCGLDLQGVADVAEAIRANGAAYLDRVYTRTERAETGERPGPLAARFAAKEAVAKALDLRDEPFAWTDIEISTARSGPPQLALTGRPARRAAEEGIDSWRLALSTSGDLAAATVLAGRAGR